MEQLPSRGKLTADSIKLYMNTDSVDQKIMANFLSITRYAGVHAMGMEMGDNINSNAAWSGTDLNGLITPGNKKNYLIYAREEGNFLLYSQGSILSNAT